MSKKICEHDIIVRTRKVRDDGSIIRYAWECSECGAGFTQKDSLPANVLLETVLNNVTKERDELEKENNKLKNETKNLRNGIDKIINGLNKIK